MFGTVYIIFTHIRDLYTMLFLFTRFVMIWWYLVHAHDEIRRMGLEGLKLGDPPHQKVSKNESCGREVHSIRCGSLQYMFFSCKYLVYHYIHGFWAILLLIQNAHVIFESFLIPVHWRLIVLAIIQEKCPPARLAWIFVCSGCRNLIPRDQFLSVSSQSQSNIN